MAQVPQLRFQPKTSKPRIPGLFSLQLQIWCPQPLPEAVAQQHWITAKINAKHLSLGWFSDSPLYRLNSDFKEIPGHLVAGMKVPRG